MFGFLVIWFLTCGTVEGKVDVSFVSYHVTSSGSSNLIYRFVLNTAVIPFSYQTGHIHGELLHQPEGQHF